MGRGDKGRRTRADLILAAREVFAEKGYFDARLADITARAGCSTGTLYTYFRNREEILGAVIDQATSELLSVGDGPAAAVPGDTGAGERPDPGEPIEGIRQGNREYVEFYARNADLMHLMEQVAHIDPHINELRLARAARFVERNARSIRRWQLVGRVDASLDAHFTAQALSSMVSRLCYHVFVDVRDPVLCTPDGRSTMVEELTRIWTNALRMT